MDKNMDWIYRTVTMDTDLEKTLEAVEKALGFKLFVWQKTYIERGYFRRYGATTAEILRELLNVSDCTRGAVGLYEKAALQCRTHLPGGIKRDKEKTGCRRNHHTSRFLYQK